MATQPKPANAAKTVEITLPADFAITVHGHTITAKDLESMSPLANAYLVGNGYKQSLTDSTAFTKEFKAGKSQAELDKAQSDKRAARHQAILSGDVGSISGSRATPIEQFMQDVAVERIKAIAVARKVPMPKKDVLKAAIASIMGKQGPDIRAEATARMSAASAAAAQAGDIFGTSAA